MLKQLGIDVGKMVEKGLQASYQVIDQRVKELNNKDGVALNKVISTKDFIYVYVSKYIQTWNDYLRLLIFP